MARLKIGNVFPPLAYLLKHCAPAGYGVGGNTKYVNDANEITATGFYVCDTNTPDNVWWYGQHIQYSADAAYQEFCRFNDTNHRICRQKIAGVWKPWEYITAPMELGVEYLTTERYTSSPVYTTLLDCGNMPSETTKSIEHGLSVHIPIRCTGSRGISSTIPNKTATEETTVCFDKTNVHIYSKTDLSAHSVFVQLWYTKS